MEEQTGVGTDCTPGSSYQQQGGQGHLGRLELTTKHFVDKSNETEAFTFSHKEVF